MSTIDQCNACRFWKHTTPSDGKDDMGRPDGWGWCRRYPPQLSERMSGMLIPSLGNREDNYDPDDVATVQNVADSSLFPATWYDRWCGEFQRPAPSYGYGANLAPISSPQGDSLLERLKHAVKA